MVWDERWIASAAKEKNSSVERSFVRTWERGPLIFVKRVTNGTRLGFCPRARKFMGVWNASWTSAYKGRVWLGSQLWCTCVNPLLPTVIKRGLTFFGHIWWKVAFLEKNFEGEMFVIPQPTTPLQIFCERVFYCEVISKNDVDPDDTFHDLQAWMG